MKLDKSLVSVAWLEKHLGDPQLVLLDASWHMPAQERDGYKEFLQQRIATAQFFDYDRKVCDQDSSLPHMLPTPELFAAEVRKLGVSRDSTIIVYDSLGVHCAARAWWMFLTMGHAQVAVLNGGMPAWIRAGKPIDTGPVECAVVGDFEASFQAEKVKNHEQVLQALGQSDTTILDARSLARFNAEVPEPRPELRRGHMPGAKCLPFESLLEAGHLLDVPELRDKFDQCVQAEQNLIFSCGSGVTAAMLALAADQIGLRNWAVYDGSWTEWGQPDADFPVES